MIHIKYTHKSAMKLHSVIYDSNIIKEMDIRQEYDSMTTHDEKKKINILYIASTNDVKHVSVKSGGGGGRLN